MAVTTNRETKLRIELPEQLNKTDRKIVSERIIEFIRKRTKAGNSQIHKKWPGRTADSAGRYTDEYAEIKGRKSPVDLKNSENMLNAMKHFSGKDKKGETTIGYNSGTKEERKAHGHSNGYINNNLKKSRPFINILKKDVAGIVTDYVAQKAKAPPKEREDRFGPRGFDPLARQDNGE